jgi:ribosomal protein S6--L-glutamate ligase
MTLTIVGFRMLNCERRVLVDQNKISLGQVVDMKELYKNSEKASSGLRIGLWPAINCTATRKPEKCVVMKCTFEHQECYMKLDAKHSEIIIVGKILNQFDAVIPRIRPSITFTVVH